MHRLKKVCTPKINCLPTIPLHNAFLLVEGVVSLIYMGWAACTLKDEDIGSKSNISERHW